MAWSHLWAPPELLTLRGNGRRLMVPRQSCVMCGTARNPFNNVITHFSKSKACRDAIETREPRDYTKELSDLETMLKSLRRQGEPVDKWHTGRKRSAVPELPLPYRD